jgi:short-subunit dehydrogenase
MRDPRSILITGASSGIGKALAIAYAGPSVTLFLSGRNGSRLELAAGACRDRGATAHAHTLDVADAAAVLAWVEACDAQAPLDLVIANAGISAGTGRGGESNQQARDIFAINVDGVLNTVLPALARMQGRGRGQVAIMSSLAAFRGFPGAPAYCASKAAVRVWGEALRGEVQRQGVEVCVICPGFVKSRMTAGNPFPMPLIMSAERAAGIICRGLARNRARIAFPWLLYAVVRFFAALPAVVTDPILSRFPKKP